MTAQEPTSTPPPNWRSGPFDDLSLRELQFIYMARQAVFGLEQNCVYQDIDGYDEVSVNLAAWSPQHGWVEFDPTNDQLADQRYITLAWGADFADVVPLRGVILGGGAQTMDVAVSVIPIEL